MRFPSVTAPAMMKLLRNSRGRPGSSSVHAVTYPSIVGCSGIQLSWKTSLFGLKLVETDHANGMNMRSA